MSSERATIVLEGRLFPEGGPARVEVQNGAIASVVPLDSLDEPAGSERWIVPGFFDLQVNGFAGRSFAEADLTVAQVEHVARALLQAGTTRFLPTLITEELEVLGHQLSVLAEAMDRIPLVRAMCPGIHLEGPFINPEDGPRGAHRRQCVLAPNRADYDRLQAAARGRIVMLTLAPEQPGASELIRHVAGQGVLVALGHHRADDETLERAVAAGARICTHLGNGSDAMLPRLANHIWRQLGDDRLWASFIADGHHLPPFTLRCMLRAKGLARSILVTDAIELAGMPPGRYLRRGLEAELTPEGKVALVGTPYLAGSVATMPLLIAHAVKDAGLNFVEAVRLATLQPEVLMRGRDVPDPDRLKPGHPTQQPEPAMRDYVTPWSCQPGQSANLAEIVWHPGDALPQVRTAVIGGFASDLNPRVLSAGQSATGN